MTQPAPNPLWSHALEVYERPGAREACLQLQDQAGAEVSVLLACLWLARRGTPPGTAQPVWASVLSQTRVLRQDVIAPVREGRRHMKCVVQTLTPPLRAHAASLRAELAATELALERLLCEQLFDAFRALPEGSAPTAALDHVQHYVQAAGLTLDAEAHAALARLIRTAA